MSRFDTCLVLHGGHKRVVSLGADMSYVEKKITKLNFTRGGECGWVTQYRKAKYEEKLKQSIVS